MSHLNRQILSASLWSVLSGGLASVARSGAYLVYVMFITPADYGLVGFGLLVVSFFVLLIENFLGFALVRHEVEDQTVNSIVLYSNIAVAVAGYGIVAGLSGPASHILGDPRLARALPLMALQLIGSGLSATHIALARRRFEFQKLFQVRLITTVLSLSVGLSLAATGHGYWSLVMAMVTDSATQTLASWALIRWRPSATLNWRAAMPLYRFAGWTAVDMGATWAIMSTGGLFLGSALGPAALGLYRVAEQVNMALFGTLLEPLNPVFYAALSKVAQSGRELHALFLRLSRLAALMATPLAGILVLVAPFLERVVGVRWDGVALYVILDALAFGFGYQQIALAPMLRATGHPKILAITRFVAIALQVPVYALVARHGVVPFLIAKDGIELAMMAMGMLAIWRVTGHPVDRLALEFLLITGATALFVFCGWGLAALIAPAGSLRNIVISLTCFLGCFALLSVPLRSRLAPEGWRRRVIELLGTA